jgi:hypothetical protein
MERGLNSVWQSSPGDRRQGRTENPGERWPPFKVARCVEADADAN